MRRTLIQLDEAIYRRLRHEAFRQERSVASLVREFIAKGIADAPDRARPRRVNQFASVKAGRSQQGRLAPVSEHHDAALAAASKT